MLRNLLNKVKKTVVSVSLSVLGFMTMASADSTALKTAMESVKTDATENVGIMLPIAIGILGVVVGATIGIAVFKKLTARIA